MSKLSSWEECGAFYDHLTRHYVPGPQSWSFFVPPLLLFFALLIPPASLPHARLAAIFLPPIYGCTLHAWRAIGGVEVLSVTAALWATALLGCMDGRTFKRVRCASDEHRLDEHNRYQEEFSEEGFPAAFGARISWVCTLLISLRLAGWKSGDHAVKSAYAPSRAAFARHALLLVMLDFLLLDVTFLYVRYDPYFAVSAISVDAPFPAVDSSTPAIIEHLWKVPFPRCLRCTVLAAQVFAVVSGMFYLPTLPAAVLNALGMLPDEWSPHTWPLFFGNFSAIGTKGLRGLWGRWWHQVNRVFVSSPGKAMVDLMRLPKRSLLRYGYLVVTSFFFSGILHAGLIPPEPLAATRSVNEMRLWAATFFWMQAPGIILETLVEKLVRRYWTGRRHGILVQSVFFGWTAAWLCMALPILTVPFREIGYWKTSPVGTGIVQPLMKTLKP